MSCPHAAQKPDISHLYLHKLLKLVSSHLGKMTSTDHTCGRAGGRALVRDHG